MKKLLIHSNNTSFNNAALFPFEEQFVFDVDFDKDVDLYIHEQLSIGPNRDKILASEVLFIKVSLSQNNYLEYLGLRLAYHIRLTKCLGDKANIPIVIIAEESFQYLGLTYSEPSILFTKGIYLIKESLDDYQKLLKSFNDGRIKPLDDFNFFVNSISISPPANFQSHHSIANEWALVRYFSMFEIDDCNELFIRLKNKLNDLDYLNTLHFKLTEAKANRQKFNRNKHTINPIIKGIEEIKIGIIDDEINKGWLEFYNYIFDKSRAKVVPFYNFSKDGNKIELINKLKSWLYDIFTSNEPIDIFIIDLRLHDDDFSEQNFENLSGIQIIKYIKSQNPGVQVVVSTASNKVWNYQKCLEAGVKYFSVKESPETYNTRIETLASYTHFSKQVSQAVQDTYLAGLFRKIEDLKHHKISRFSREKDKVFANLTFGKNGLLDQIFNLLVLDNSDEAVIHQCLLIAFQILENYCELKSIGIFDFKNSSGKVCQLNNNKLIDIFTLSSDNKNILTKLEIIKGRIEFQNENGAETIKSFRVFENSVLLSSYSGGIDATSLIKIISILHFRHSIDKLDIERIIALRYYRSNVAAHLTGGVNADYKIDANDIAFFINLFTMIFN